MPFYNEHFHQDESPGSEMTQTKQSMNTFQSFTNNTVFSKHGGYNPTSLAVEQSLEEIFETFYLPVTQEFKDPHFLKDTWMS